MHRKNSDRRGHIRAALPVLVLAVCVVVFMTACALEEVFRRATSMETEAGLATPAASLTHTPPAQPEPTYTAITTQASVSATATLSLSLPFQSEPTNTVAATATPYLPLTFITATAPRPLIFTPPALRPAPTVLHSPSPIPQSEGWEGKIAFPLFDRVRQTYDIYVARPDGSRQLLAREASQPAFSPDGRQIAFRSWRGDAIGLMVADSEGKEARRITIYAEDALPTWSREAPLLAFCSQRESNRRWRIFGVMANGEYEWALERGTNAVLGMFPAWLPGSRIVYAGCIENDCGLQLIYGEGTPIKNLTGDPRDTAPAPSPDGSKIAFMSYREGDWEIYILSLEGSEAGGPIRLTESPSADGLPAWSPDGKFIAFLSDRSGEWAVWAMNPDGSHPRMLFSLGGGLGSGEKDWTMERISWGT